MIEKAKNHKERKKNSKNREDKQRGTMPMKWGIMKRQLSHAKQMGRNKEA